MTCGVVALQRRVMAQLVALVARAPAELGRPLLEVYGTLALGARGVLVVGVLALEAKRLAGSVAIEPAEGLPLFAGERGVSEEPCKRDRKDWSCLHLHPFIQI